MPIVKSPGLWGTPLWNILHFITFRYTPREAAQMKRLFQRHVPKLLPCDPCRKHYCRYIKLNPIRLESRESLSRWLVKIHNMTNKQLGKPHFKYEDAVRRYDSHYGKLRARKDFFRWAHLMVDNIRTGSIEIQSSYSELMQFVMNYV
tara:strand:+ start:762 stop:1202 length:441 start_codon:yes stop_codon:yes gene_type:complete